MNFIDQDDCNILFNYEDEIIFYPYYNNVETPEHSGSTDLEQKFENERKESIQKKRIEKNLKIQSDSNNNNLSKEELRRSRNRNSAQQSRDRKKQQFEQLILENQNYQILLKEKEEQIQQLIDEKNQQRFKIQYLEELSQNYKCLNCFQEQNHEIIKVNVITKQKTMNYGLIPLLTITCILSIVNNEYEFLHKPNSLLQISDLKFKFLYSQQQYSNPTQSSFQNSLQKSQYNIQTLFYNTKGYEKDENAHNLNSVTDAVFQLTSEQDQQLEKGSDVYLVKIKRDDEDNFKIFKARCQIIESSKLMFERESYDSFSNSFQY